MVSKFHLKEQQSRMRYTERLGEGVESRAPGDLPWGDVRDHKL